MVCMPSHVAPATHCPLLQRPLDAQSESAAHEVRHAFVVGSHVSGKHGLVIAAGQLPLPSQLAGSVATPFVQLALLHDCDDPTKPPHVPRVVPSHCAVAHTSASPPFGHAPRAPCGAPDTGAHVPSAPATSHASHCPPHAALQQ
jgi:hypothetical protein